MTPDQIVVDHSDPRECDPAFELDQPRLTPAGGERAVANLGDGLRSEHKQLPGKVPVVQVRDGAVAATEWRTEDAGIDNDRVHASSAA